MATESSGKRRFGRSLLSLCVGGLLLAPAASAAPAAVDQYTEAPPAGPGGSSTQLETPQSTPSHQGSGGAQPAPVSAAPPPAEPAEPAPQPAAHAPGPRAKPAPKPHVRHRQQARPASHRSAAHRTVAPVSPVGDRDELPLAGYPLTRFVLVVLVIVLAALLVRAGIVVYGRMRGPARDAG